MSSRVRLELGPIAVLRLSDPPLNLITRGMTLDLQAALSRLERSVEARVVIVAGGSVFSAGSDVNELAKLHGRVVEEKLLLQKYVYRQLAGLGVPTIAALEGDAIGGGLELALCCDLRVASERAHLGLPEVGLGTMPGSGGTQRLPRLVGVGHAKELILTGEIITANRAARIGLINRVTEVGQAEAVAMELAGVIGARAPIAVREAKRALDLALDGPLDAGLAAELAGSERLSTSGDLQEGTRAFREKRPPHFKGR